jgi:hypothetical protein
MLTCLLDHEANVNLKNIVSSYFDFSVILHSLVNRHFCGPVSLLQVDLCPIWRTKKLTLTFRITYIPKMTYSSLNFL